MNFFPLKDIITSFFIFTLQTNITFVMFCVFIKGNEKNQYSMKYLYMSEGGMPDMCLTNFFRGDTPFCTEECRHEQIEMDEAKEKNRNFSSMKALRKEQKKSSTTTKSQNYTFRTGTLAAA